LRLRTRRRHDRRRVAAMMAPDGVFADWIDAGDLARTDATGQGEVDGDAILDLEAMSDDARHGHEIISHRIGSPQVAHTSSCRTFGRQNSPGAS